MLRNGALKAISLSRPNVTKGDSPQSLSNSMVLLPRIPTTCFRYRGVSHRLVQTAFDTGQINKGIHIGNIVSNRLWDTQMRCRKLPVAVLATTMLGGRYRNLETTRNCSSASNSLTRETPQEPTRLDTAGRVAILPTPEPLTDPFARCAKTHRPGDL